MYRDHSTCRACGSLLVDDVFSLGIQPLANDFHKPGQSRNGFAPLKIYLCDHCSLAQLSVVVDPDTLYGHYSYVTSTSETMKRHFESLRKDIEAEAKFFSVVEIGSNDGALLEYLGTKWGTACIGVDPAANLAEIAAKRGVRNIVSVWDEDAAKDALRILGGVYIVIARHVFAHTDNWKDFMRCIELVSNPETVVCIECPYAGDMLEKYEWDTIYHEHLSYVTVKSIDRLLSGTAFHLHKIIRYPVHGGSFLFMLRHNDHGSIRDISVDELIGSENIDSQAWKAFATQSSWQMMQLSEYVRKLVDDGKTVVGFGASAKCTVAVNACGFTREHLRFITDTTPQKQGCYCPGTSIPIVPQSDLLAHQPDYAVCFAWNYREEILKSQEEYRKRGGKFIFFVPKLEVV